ncbi:MAG: hypothetical protein AB7Q42_04915 [Acidimicrobiia bacterium]
MDSTSAAAVQWPLLVAVALGSVLLSPILFAFELVFSVLLIAFAVAFHRLRPFAATRMITIGAGLAVGPLAYVLLAVVVAVL